MSTIICQIILSSFLWICFELGWCRVTAKLATDLLSSESYFGSLKSGCFGVRPKDERSSLGLLITVWRYVFVADFEALSCQVTRKFIRCSNAETCTISAIKYTACYKLAVLVSRHSVFHFCCIFPVRALG